ncbi:hypothetical protein ACFV27_27195 [Streptomyces antimycoticus]|uniref:hypothetical protein n=1 Tax=Streptomyces antimycoticus TaxID=68175 RepID=UPI0036CA72CD
MPPQAERACSDPRKRTSSSRGRARRPRPRRYVWLSDVDTTSSYVTAVRGPLPINGVSAGLTFMPAASPVMGGVGPEHAGPASDLLQTVQRLGGAIGLAVIVPAYAAGSIPGRPVPGARAIILADRRTTTVRTTDRG